MKALLEKSGYLLDPGKNVWAKPNYIDMNYSDGDETELRIGSIIEQATDITVLSTELRRHCTDWPTLYHLSGTRANILRPFAASLTGKILEIGAGCGAITRYLGECGADVLALEGSLRRAAIVRSRTRDLENVTVLAEKFDEFKCDYKFDVITLIGVLEYANLFSSGETPVLSMLERVRALLKPQGKLIIAIENQLGLKYFAGAPEDHLGQPMYGIEGRYRKDQPQTFGRTVLARKLKKAGFSTSEFLAPFPDYKLPVSIITEEGINNKDFDAAALAWQSARRDSQLPHYCNFSLELAWPEIFKNRMALYVANSFLIIASTNVQQLTETGVLAYHYTTDRVPQYCKESRFEVSASDGISVVYKLLAAVNKVEPSIDNRIIGFGCPVSAKYISGKLLSWEFVQIVTRDGWTIEDVGSFIKRYVAVLEILASRFGLTVSITTTNSKLPGKFFDIIPQNIIIRADGSPEAIDTEWIAGDDIEVGQLLLRAMLLMIGSVTRFSNNSTGRCFSRIEFTKTAFDAAGFALSDKDISRFMEFEATVQEQVTGRVASEFLVWWPEQRLSVHNLSQALLERDGQIAGRNQSLAERDGQISNLNQAIVDRDGQIANLNQDVTERGEQITNLNQDVTERGEQITNLNQVVAERDGQISGLNQLLAARDGQIANLNQAVVERDRQITQIISSYSWRITLPLRVGLEKYQKAVEKPLPMGTRRRYYYELGLSGIWIILSEGWPSFFRKAKKWLQYSKTTSKRRNALTSSPVASLFRKEENIVFPSTSHPEVSIVISVQNKWKNTIRCLRSLCENTTGNYEVIVVDDASTDQTVWMVLKVRNLRLVRNKENVGFIDSCNRGATRSKGDYILFLNNDMVVNRDWLPPLLETIRRVDVGAVGSKLVYPNGTLQAAGGIIWSDGSWWNYGRSDDADKPEYNYVREVDYCSGACLVVKRKLFEEVGGFDNRFKPAYYEDTDLCFSFRNIGYKVIYQPKSVVTNFEGVTSGTDTSGGVKKYQEINKLKFAEKWAGILQKVHYTPSLDNVIWARDRRLGERVLVIDHYVPMYDRDSGSLRMFNILGILSELGHKVTFIGDNLLRNEPYAQELQQKGIEVIYAPHVLSVKKYIKELGRYFSVVMLSRPHISIKYIDSVKSDCPTAKIIYDTVDIVFLREIRRAMLENSEEAFREAENHKRTELYLAQNSDITLVVSPEEKEVLLKENSSLNIEIVSNIHRITKPQTPFSGRKDILFIGGFDHPPNTDSAVFFVNEVFPLIKQKLPSLHVYIVGNNPTKQVVGLKSGDVIVTGYVSDLTPYFEKCKVFVAPLRYGAGVKGKINQSMSYGLPVVTTSIGAEGIGLVDGVDALIADKPDDFAEKVAMVYENEELWNKLSTNSIDNVRTNFSPEVAKEKLKTVLNTVVNKDAVIEDILSRMSGDWNSRAMEDFKHYISYSATEGEFEESGKINVHDYVVKDMELISGGMEPRKMRVLEIGCGAGRMTKYLGELFGEVHGVDISDEMVRVGNKRIESMPNVFLHTNNGRDLSTFPDGFFDFVFSFIVFQHIPEQEIVIGYIKEASRVLRSGGLFKFQAQGYQGQEYLMAEKDTWLGVSFSEEEIRHVAKSLNFEVSAMSGQGTQYFWISLKKLHREPFFDS